MPRLTNADFINRVKRLTGDEYTVLGTYVKAKIKILMRHNNCGHEWEITPDNFSRGYR